jgi:hypothetical protein
METFWRLVDQIPASFWGVVVGSFFSVLGVALSNRASDKRLLAQFKHEHKLKTKDREMALRKEIFLDAAEAISAGLSAVGRISNLELENDQVMAVYLEKAPAIAKVHVVASEETVKVLSQLMGDMAAAYLKLFARRYELMAVKNQIINLNNQVAEFGKERQKYLALMQQYNIEVVVDKQRWDAVNKGYEFENKRAVDAGNQGAELSQSLQAQRLEFVKECTSVSAKLSEMIIPVVLSARKELELPLDAEIYRFHMNEAQMKQTQAIDGFLQKFIPTKVGQITQSDIAK